MRKKAPYKYLALDLLSSIRALAVRIESVHSGLVACCAVSKCTIKKIAGALRAIMVAMLLLPGAIGSASADEPAREYRIKAAYLYNLSKFIEWPEEKSREAETSFTICVYGHNPFADSLEKLREHTVKGRSIAVRYVPENQPIDSCQLVFLSRDNTTLPKILNNSSSAAPILSVGDDKNFLANGGIICLLTESDSVLLDINLTRAKQLGFTISANLLEIAHKIQ